MKPAKSTVSKLDKAPKPEKFFRLVEHDLENGDTLRGYQPELVEILGDRVTHRTLLEKPDVFEYAQTRLIDLIDPRINRREE